jgi:hypothetical protein
MVNKLRRWKNFDLKRRKIKYINKIIFDINWIEVFNIKVDFEKKNIDLFGRFFDEKIEKKGF